MCCILVNLVHRGCVSCFFSCSIHCHAVGFDQITWVVLGNLYERGCLASRMPQALHLCHIHDRPPPGTEMDTFRFVVAYRDDIDHLQWSARLLQIGALLLQAHQMVVCTSKHANSAFGERLVLGVSLVKLTRADEVRSSRSMRKLSRTRERMCTRCSGDAATVSQIYLMDVMGIG